MNLWKKQLGRVPDSVWEQTELESLVLAENGLSEVSEQIGRLKRLRMLDLGLASSYLNASSPQDLGSCRSRRSVNRFAISAPTNATRRCSKM